jgi:hypothetical protein
MQATCRDGIRGATLGESLLGGSLLYYEHCGIGVSTPRSLEARAPSWTILKSTKQYLIISLHERLYPYSS